MGKINFPGQENCPRGIWWIYDTFTTARPCGCQVLDCSVRYRCTFHLNAQVVSCAGVLDLGTLPFELKKAHCLIESMWFLSPGRSSNVRHGRRSAPSCAVLPGAACCVVAAAGGVWVEAPIAPRWGSHLSSLTGNWGYTQWEEPWSMVSAGLFSIWV